MRLRRSRAASPNRRSENTWARSGCGCASHALWSDARGFAQFAALGQHAAGKRRRRHESRRELCRFERQRLGAVAVGFFGGERARGEHHRALAAIAFLVERALVALPAAPARRPNRRSTQRNSSTALPAQPSDGFSRAASSANACALTRSPRRCASTKRPCSPSALVSARLAMARKAAVGRLAIAGKLRVLRAEQQRTAVPPARCAWPPRHVCVRRPGRLSRRRSSRAKSPRRRARRGGGADAGAR